MRIRSKCVCRFDRLVEDGAQGALRPSCPTDEAINPTAEPVSSDGGDQPQTPNRCPVTEAINFQPPDGCPTGEGLVTPTVGLDRGRRTSVNSVVSARAGCEGPMSNSALPAFPRGRPGESESSSGRTRATGITHPDFYGRKPWKKPNSTLIINGPRPAEEGLRRPFRKPPPNRSQELTANPPPSRPGYRHKSPRVSLFRSSRFPIALRVSKSAV